MLLKRTNHYATITLFLFLYLVALPRSPDFNNNTQVDLSDQLIVSIANLSGHLCTLDTLNLHDSSITRDSPPTILPNLSERSFWFSDPPYLFSNKMGVSLTYTCGNEKFTITSSQNSCRVLPSGSVESFGLKTISVDFEVTPGHCVYSGERLRTGPAAVGMIMWKILPNK